MLRTATYRRLRRHWQFVNELSLFDIDHHQSYGVHVYNGEHAPNFSQATSLYHPSTTERSMEHDGSGSEPGLKDAEGHWDLRPHASRIQHVDVTTLRTWHAFLEQEEVPASQARMVYTVNRATAAVLNKLANAPRIGSLGLRFSAGWHEKNDRTKGRFDSTWGVPESWDSVILQGPHLHVSNPFYKSPNPTMLHNQDWTGIDLEALSKDVVPATQYKRRGGRVAYDSSYTHWMTGGERRSSRSEYRLAYRRMAANTGERTLIPALLPPGAAHVNALFTYGLPGGSAQDLLLALGSASSMLLDFAVRAVPKGDIYQGAFERLPLANHPRYSRPIVERTLRLNALTSSYSAIWESVMGSQWTPDVPLRMAALRRQALVEIDALVALSLGITAEELITIYRTQFPVLYGYDHGEYLYDKNGRLVPANLRQIWKKAGSPELPDGLGLSTRSIRHPESGVVYVYELPFTWLDREVDLRIAYAQFEFSAANSA